MEIIVNGTPESVSVRTLAELVASREWPAKALVVELNQRIVRQEQWPQTRLYDGDRLELLSFVGGG